MIDFIIYTLNVLSFFLPVLTVLCGFFFLKKSYSYKYIILFFTLLFALGTYTRFIEPQILHVSHQKINAYNFDSPLRIAVIADIHLGLFKDETFLERIVEKTNDLNPDIILLPGDFVYHVESASELKKLFAPFQKIQSPMYGVLGNHDFGVGMGSELDLSQEITQELEALGVNMIDNSIVDISHNNNKISLIGIGSFLGEDSKTQHIARKNNIKNPLLLFHNPDTLSMLPQDSYYNLSVAGHTHCGQIRVPGYQYNIPTEGTFDKGLTQEENTQLYISCGLGEVGLPLRFLNPPELTILEVY